MANAVEETEAEEEFEVEGSTRGRHSQMEKHEAFVDWYLEAYEVDLNEESAPEIIAVFAAKRNEFRKSDGYLEQWGPEAKEEAKAAREAAKAERDAAREAAKAAKAATEAKAPAKSKATDNKSAAKKVASKPRSRAKAKAAEDEVFE